MAQKDKSLTPPKAELIQVTKENVKSLYQGDTVFIIKQGNKLLGSFAKRPYVKPGQHYVWPWLWDGEVQTCQIRKNDPETRVQYDQWESELKDIIRKEASAGRLFAIPIHI